MRSVRLGILVLVWLTSGVYETRAVEIEIDNNCKCVDLSDLEGELPLP